VRKFENKEQSRGVLQPEAKVPSRGMKFRSVPPAIKFPIIPKIRRKEPAVECILEVSIEDYSQLFRASFITLGYSILVHSLV
jgi:hypothetical protein